MKKNFVDLTPEEVNSFLIEKYGLGLLGFSFIVANILKIEYHRKRINYQISEDMIKKFQNLKNKIIDTMLDYEASVFRWSDRKICYKKNWGKIEKEVLTDYKLNEFFKEINHGISILKYRRALKHPGAPIKIRNQITSSWALSIKKRGRRIDWELIAELIDWFWQKLKNHEPYADLKPTYESTDTEYIKNQFYRNKNKHDIKYAARFPSIPTIIVFPEKTFNKIPLTIFLGRGAKTPKGTVIYPQEKIIPIYEDFLSKKISLLQIPSENWQYVYLYYVGKIYENHPAAKSIIIFPDLSYLAA
jgi:hypothetical protein